MTLYRRRLPLSLFQLRPLWILTLPAAVNVALTLKRRLLRCAQSLRYVNCLTPTVSFHRHWLHYRHRTGDARRRVLKRIARPPGAIPA